MVEKTVKYFAYGSNMNAKKLEGCRIKPISSKMAILENYKLSFTRKSEKWKCGVADIVESQGDKVYGVLYEIKEEDIEKLDRKEGVKLGSYKRYNVKVIEKESEREIEKVLTYKVRKPEFKDEEKKIGKYKPSEEYLTIIIEGAKEHNLPSEYIDKILEIAEEHGVDREIIEKLKS